MALTPLQTEAFAMYEGINEAYNKGFRSIQILTDSSDFVQTIANSHQPFEISALVHDIKTICSKFNSCRIRKVSRQEIGPPHDLAIAARVGKIVN